jgi:hypothetical protein
MAILNETCRQQISDKSWKCAKPGMRAMSIADEYPSIAGLGETRCAFTGAYSGAFSIVSAAQMPVCSRDERRLPVMAEQRLGRWHRPRPDITDPRTCWREQNSCHARGGADEPDAEADRQQNERPCERGADTPRLQGHEATLSGPLVGRSIPLRVRPRGWCPSA